MHGQWVVESLSSKFMDDVRNEAHQDHEPNERHKARKRIAVPGMSKQEIGGIGFHQVVPVAGTRLGVGFERLDALCYLYGQPNGNSESLLMATRDQYNDDKQN